MGEGERLDVRSLAATFRTGAQVDVHQHHWGQLVFASSGLMRVSTDETLWLVPSTRAIWVPAGCRHSIAICGEVAIRTLYIDERRAMPLPQAARVLEVVPLLRELILHIIRLGMLSPAIPEQDRLAGLLIDLLLQARPQDLNLPLPGDPRARRLAALIESQPAEAADLNHLAGRTGASLRTLQRLFPRETGLTIEAWRQKARLLHAIARLSAGAGVTDAALDCGYQSVAAFIDVFSKQFGVTPGRYFDRR
jgi:AraC-like DNA-binding protein